MFKADSHIHTRYSDGYNTVEEVVQIAKDKGLTHIAMTDHDSLKGYDHKKAVCQRAGIKTVKSIELSAIDFNTNTKVHLLGYNIKEDKLIEEFCRPIVEQRNEKGRKQVEILNSLGYEITFDQLYDFSGGYIFKQQIFDLLYMSGQTESIFPKINETLFKHNGIADIHMEYLDVFKAVKVIKDSGGFAVIGHPCQQNNIYLVDSLVKIGLDGLELNHEANTDAYKKIIKEKAEKYNLLLTGGSDYHGKYARRTNEIGSYICEENAKIIFE